MTGSIVARSEDMPGGMSVIGFVQQHRPPWPLLSSEQRCYMRCERESTVWMITTIARNTPETTA